MLCIAPAPLLLPCPVVIALDEIILGSKFQFNAEAAVYSQDQVAFYGHVQVVLLNDSDDDVHVGLDDKNHIA